jgi:selenocysteine-specific elongation factor
MVAGAGGLDLVCLVIAADEGIMPQTREHLDICELLGVRRGVVALTKRDLVDDDWLVLVREEVRTGLAGSFLGAARIIPVSARTGDGMAELRGELAAQAAAIDARSADGLFRMPLDRVFTIRGFGTVVTGTVLGGRVKLGDTVVAQPRGVEAKVRGIEVHAEVTQEARAGMRCALNLSGVARDDVARGDLLAHPEAVAQSHLIDAQFRYLRTSRGPLGRRSRVLLHHGTAQLSAALVLVEGDSLAPGQEALVQLHLDASTPLSALPGDRFIARGFVVQEHYGTTIGGGEILRVHAPKVRRSSLEATTALRQIAGAGADERVALEVKSGAAAGMTSPEIARRLGIAEPTLQAALTRLIDAGEVISAGDGASAVYCHAEPFARLEKQAVAAVEAFHRAHPERDAMAREELRGKLPAALPPRMFERIMESLLRRAGLAAERDLVRRPAARPPGLERQGSELDERIAAQFRAWGVTPKRPKDVPAELRVDERQVRAAMERLLAARRLVRVKPDFYIDAAALAGLRSALERHLDAHGQITPTEWKDITGTSRKYSIPLAEYFDAEKLTLRVGEIRKRRG